MVPDKMGFLYPKIDYELCTDCGICDSICSFKPSQRKDDIHAEAIRFPSLMDKSQSGGLAFALMRKAILNGYVVYGAAIDEDFSVSHRRVDDEAGLEPLRLSKYVQSNMAGIPGRVMQDLKQGRKVLFTGTPCQCAGIASIAKNHRDKLLLADIVCHGVPAPAVWKDYLEYCEELKGDRITSVCFRDPSSGWHNPNEVICFGKERTVSKDYTFLYYRRLMFRPSCLVCPFASLNRPSDITMADCWGIEKALPGFADDNIGCSLMLVHNRAGQEFCEEFFDESKRQVVDIEKVMQPNLSAPSQPHKRAKSFENTYIRKGFAAAFKRFGPYSRAYRLEQFIKKVKRHL